MKQTIIFLIAGILLLTSCVSSTPNMLPSIALTPSFTSKPTPTQISSQTPTIISSITLTTSAPTFTTASVATLTSHDWRPSPILITYDKDWDGFCSTVCPPDPAPLILYGDGNFFLYTSVDINNNTYFRYLHKKLDRNEICRILNTIDQTGFFDFDPSTYSKPEISDAANWRVEIHAWRNKDVTLYALGDAIDFLDLDPSNEINPSSVRDAFTLLYKYPSDGLDVYIPQLLGIWLWKSSFESSPAKVWTVDSISLGKLYKKAGSAVDTMPRPIYLAGKDAQNIYAMFNDFNYYGEVTQNGERYGIYVRPVLPFEIISRNTSVISPNVSQMKLPSSLRCDSSDGIMPIPLYSSR